MTTGRMLGALLFITMLCGSCKGVGTETIAYYLEVEIAPGTWLLVGMEQTAAAGEFQRGSKDPHNLPVPDAIKQFGERGGGGASRKEKSCLAFEWRSKRVQWRGRAQPISLREDGGRLYMIGFDRSTMSKAGFVYFALNEDGTALSRIDRAEYPRRIATQNLWLRPDTRYFAAGDTRVDSWKVLRELEIENPGFRHTYTARIWDHIETGIDYWQRRVIPQSFLRTYVERYKPVALPIIVRE